MLKNKLSGTDVELLLLRWRENEDQTNRIQYEENLTEMKADF